jgi:formate dehydrogenase major subunit
MTNDLAEFSEFTKCFLITGSNTSENHPIVAMHVFRALERGAKLIVMDPRKQRWPTRLISFYRSLRDTTSR